MTISAKNSIVPYIDRHPQILVRNPNHSPVVQLDQRQGPAVKTLLAGTRTYPLLPERKNPVVTYTADYGTVGLDSTLRGLWIDVYA